MHLIVGLGNPGNKYAKNRHNIGAMAIDEIARQNSFSPFRSKFKGLLAEGKLGNERVALLKPQTFMNNSGDSVQAAAKFFKLEPAQISVIYDELDLVPGKVRVKTGGGNGGHNGLRSIDPQIGRDYQRVRLGIGHPGHKEMVTRHVLSDFHKIDYEWLDPLLDAIAKNAAMLVTGDASGFMNKMALAVQTADEKAQDRQSQPADKQSKGKLAENRKHQPAKQPSSPDGKMASMLKKLFTKD